MLCVEIVKNFLLSSSTEVEIFNSNLLILKLTSFQALLDLIIMIAVDKRSFQSLMVQTLHATNNSHLTLSLTKIEIFYL